MIDTETTGSPGWWMKRLCGQLNTDRRTRFTPIERYYCSVPPIPWGSEHTQVTFGTLQKASRTNYAHLIIEAPCERIKLISIRTKADSDSDGDKDAWKLVLANDLDVQLGKAARLSRRFGRAYLSSARPEPGGTYSVVTAEDPRQCITEPDALNPMRTRAALKAYHDPVNGVDVVILWLPGQKWVATSPAKRETAWSNGVVAKLLAEPAKVEFNPRTWTLHQPRPDGWTGDEPPGGWLSETYSDDAGIPVEVLPNNDDMLGDYERHFDVLDRINIGTYQRLVIATMQAFRQLAIEQSADPNAPELPKNDPKTDEPIDYNETFQRGPDGLWILPPGAKLWESMQAELSGIISASREDLRTLGTVTRTPITVLSPDGVNQSAAGIDLNREGTRYKVEQWTTTASRALARILARAFRYMGDTERGDAEDISLTWGPSEMYSLGERAQASSMAKDTLTWDQRQTMIWHTSPQDLPRIQGERQQDIMIDQQAKLLAGAGASRANTNN